MGSTGHLSVQPGKRVILHMRSGDNIIGKFLERKSSRVLVDIGLGIQATIPTKDIRTISIYKEQL